MIEGNSIDCRSAYEGRIFDISIRNCLGCGWFELPSNGKFHCDIWNLGQRHTQNRPQSDGYGGGITADHRVAINLSIRNNHFHFP
jgi:hypothetical protein